MKIKIRCRRLFVDDEYASILWKKREQYLRYHLVVKYKYCTLTFLPSRAAGLFVFVSFIFCIFAVTYPCGVVHERGILFHDQSMDVILYCPHR